MQSTKNTEEREGKFVSLPYIPCLSEKISKILRKNDLITAHKPVDKIKSTVFTKLKDHIPKMQQIGVVYCIPCKKTCGMKYIGHTSQTLEKRTSQHKYTH